MSYYTTPRRRHSSLFERMQNQIKKISKKLSAAKQSYKQSTLKPKSKHFSSYNSMEERNPPTVRKNADPTDTTQSLRPNTVLLRRRGNTGSKAETINLEQTIMEKPHYHNSNRIILKLQDENSKLHRQLGKLEQICEDQSYKLGFMKAELKQTHRELQIQKQKQFKQNCYLVSLLQHYKKKAHKYKKMINEVSSQVSIDLGSDNNS